MIDTIILILDENSFEIINPDAFTPSAQWIHKKTYALRGILSKQNPTKKELVAGIYKTSLNSF